MKIENDNGCGWLNQLPKRLNIKTLNEDLICDYLIVGAGYTGLSVARKLSEIDNKKNIILIDAQLAGEGGSSRRNKTGNHDFDIIDHKIISIHRPTKILEFFIHLSIMASGILSFIT